MKWYSLTNIKLSSSNHVSAEAQVRPDSPWFSGHFPGEPILPGVAQVAMVFDAIRQATDKDLKISAIKRVRFKQLIRPNDRLTITAVPDKRNPAYSFRIIVGEEVACNGILVINC